MRHGLLTLFGLVGVVAVVAAFSTIWLVMQEPFMVADALSSGRYDALLAALGQELGHWCRALVTLL